MDFARSCLTFVGIEMEMKMRFFIGIHRFAQIRKQIHTDLSLRGASAAPPAGGAEQATKQSRNKGIIA